MQTSNYTNKKSRRTTFVQAYCLIIVIFVGVFILQRKYCKTSTACSVPASFVKKISSPPSFKKMEKSVAVAVKEEKLPKEEMSPQEESSPKVISDVVTYKEKDLMYFRIHSFTPEGRVLLTCDSRGGKPIPMGDEEVRKIVGASVAPILVLEGGGKVGDDAVTIVTYTKTSTFSNGEVRVTHPIYHGIKCAPHDPSECEAE